MNWLRILHESLYGKIFNNISNKSTMDKRFANEVRLIDIRTFDDNRGSLCVIESKKDLPFEIKRIFYVVGTKKYVSRGNHAHRTSEQLLIILNGYLRVSVENRGKVKSFLLSSSNIGLYLPPLSWSVETPIENGTIYLVLSSAEYKESDYIRNYSDFVKVGDSL